MVGVQLVYDGAPGGWVVVDAVEATLAGIELDPGQVVGNLELHWMQTERLHMKGKLALLVRGSRERKYYYVKIHGPPPLILIIQVQLLNAVSNYKFYRNIIFNSWYKKLSSITGQPSLTRKACCCNLNYYRTIHHLDRKLSNIVYIRTCIDC